MAAIITEQFRKQNANLWLDDITNENYYIGIGQQNFWPETRIGAPYPYGTYEDANRVLEHLTGLFKVAAKQFVIPNVALEHDVKYKVYDPMDPTCFYPDKEIELYSCYAIRNDIIYLCIHKAEDTTVMSEQSVITAFDLNSINNDSEYISLKTYGVKTINGYTWAYLGETDKYHLVNSKDFVAINDVYTSVDAEIQNATTYARALVNPAGFKNDFVVLADENYPGEDGNNLAIQLIADPEAAPLSADISGPVVVPNQTVGTKTGVAVVQFTFGPVASADNIVQYINSGDNYFDAYASATGEGIGGEPLQEVGPVLLSGGNTGNSYIRERTGGMIFGFTVLNGGKNYRVVDQEEPGELYAPLRITARLTGLDEFGNTRTEDIPVNVKYYNDQVTPENSHILTINLSDPPTQIKPNEADVNKFDDPYYKLRGWKSVKVTLPEWTLANNFSDPIDPDPCGERRVLDIRAHIGPTEGFGFNKTQTLPAWYLGVYADTCEATYIADGTTYHQLSLIKNPLKTDDNRLTGPYYQPLGWFELGVEGDGHTPDLQLEPGWRIYQEDVEIGVLSHIQYTEDNEDHVALDPVRYYYNHSHSFGYTPLLTDAGSGAVRFVSPDGTGTVDTGLIPQAIFAAEDYQRGTGEVLFIDNRSSVFRSPGQNEEVKLVIQL